MAVINQVPDGVFVSDRIIFHQFKNASYLFNIEAGFKEMRRHYDDTLCYIIKQGGFIHLICIHFSIVILAVDNESMARNILSGTLFMGCRRAESQRFHYLKGNHGASKCMSTVPGMLWNGHLLLFAWSVFHFVKLYATFLYFALSFVLLVTFIPCFHVPAFHFIQSTVIVMISMYFYI